MIALSTSGYFEVTEEFLTLNSDTLQINSSKVEYLNDHKNSSIKFEVVYRDIVGDELHIPATIIATYGNKSIKTYQCDEDGEITLDRQDLIDFEVRWLGALPLHISLHETKSNNIRVTLLESSIGNASFINKKYLFRRDKLKEVEGNQKVLFIVR